MLKTKTFSTSTCKLSIGTSGSRRLSGREFQPQQKPGGRKRMSLLHAIASQAGHHKQWLTPRQRVGRPTSRPGHGGRTHVLFFLTGDNNQQAITSHWKLARDSVAEVTSYFSHSTSKSAYPAAFWSSAAAACLMPTVPACHVLESLCSSILYRVRSCSLQGSHYVAHPKFQNFSRTSQDPQDIFPHCFCNPTTYKFIEKQQLLITEHFKNIVTVVHNVFKMLLPTICTDNVRNSLYILHTLYTYKA